MRCFPFIPQKNLCEWHLNPNTTNYLVNQLNDKHGESIHLNKFCDFSQTLSLYDMNRRSGTIALQSRNNDDDNFDHPLGSIDDYSIIHRIGRGKYSNVFRGRSSTGDFCVIKVLKPVRMSKINREIKILESLKGGPYISQLRDIVRDKDSNSIALILDWAENMSIRATFQQLTTKHMAIYVYKVLKALEFAHSHGIMHRDVKPGNIMYDPNTNDVHLIDWGLAEYYEPGTAYPVRVATRHYKSPELLLQYQTYDYSLDIWCLGCTLAGLLFQKVPFFQGNDTDEQIIKLAEIFGGNEFIQYAEKYQLHLSARVAAALPLLHGKPWTNWKNNKNRKNVTVKAIDLLSKLLTIDHQKRPTATEALKHPFFNQIRDFVE
ncbi:CMGC family protein kinase [Tritrichomonas foetus]|uniref:non-specific serine/threonine protein kinase n=1 Tax=Tritrichomonas foetus TaxID=1144522 RepID=A0A1J4L2S2_9EUKA|nr:CMGC family protein kinase [Tritrichomonas foetus]|eukprot:OHT17698.1 CMGC family protein kinase [Tritrichomonas foetus]